MTSVYLSSDKPLPNVDFPLIDYHVHLTENFTIETAVKLSKESNVKFGIVEHPGPQFGITDDDGLLRYIERLRQYPVYVGFQPMHLNWAAQFSDSVLDQLDYILMDADTVPLGNDDYLRIWQHDLYIDDLEAFMTVYMDHIENILKNEPITIFGRPTYLPVNFGRYYDAVWTDERVSRMIELAKARNIAFEISTPMHVPGPAIIDKAKDAGIQFTFGTNARNHSAGKLHYGLKMVEVCGLTREDMFIIE